MQGVERGFFGVCVCVFVHARVHVCVAGLPAHLALAQVLSSSGPRMSVPSMPQLALQSDWNKGVSQLAERSGLCCVLLCCFYESGTRNMSSDYYSSVFSEP